MPGADPEFTATQAPTELWGQFGFGYRGHFGDPRDGAKVGRLAMSVGNDLFAGIGWSWNYDAGVRLSEATPGRGELQGTPDAEDPGFRHQYLARASIVFLLYEVFVHGTFEYLERSKKAEKAGISYEKQLEMDFKDSGPLIETPFGYVQNPWLEDV